jgi:transcriptional regulator with XRE-family HTH domain
MAAGSPPSLRQRRLGAELRKLREKAGLTSTEAAALLGVQQARMSMIEAGRYAVSAERVAAMAYAYACDDSALVSALTAMTGGRVRGWWDEYRELLPTTLTEVAELEHDARAFRVAVVAVMPGLLQTLEHARAVCRQSVPVAAPHEVEHRVSFRIKRQAVLYDVPRPYVAVVHEAALRMGTGGPDIARAQLEHLLAMSERDNVSVLAVPFERFDFPVAGQPITYVAGAVPQLDTVALDSDHGCTLLDGEAPLARYRAVLDRMEGCALSPSKSRDLIRRIAKTT